MEVMACQLKQATIQTQDLNLETVILLCAITIIKTSIS